MYNRSLECARVFRGLVEPQTPRVYPEESYDGKSHQNSPAVPPRQRILLVEIRTSQLAYPIYYTQQV